MPSLSLRFLCGTSTTESKHLQYPLALKYIYPFLAYALDFHTRHLLALPLDDSLWLLYAHSAAPKSV
jgi:hypothetical protein